MRIKSRQTGLEQNVSKATFDAMEGRKPGLHKIVSDDVPTPPEAAEQPATANKPAAKPQPEKQ